MLSMLTTSYLAFSLNYHLVLIKGVPWQILLRPNRNPNYTDANANWGSTANIIVDGIAMYALELQQQQRPQRSARNMSMTGLKYLNCGRMKLNKGSAVERNRLYIGACTEDDFWKHVFKSRLLQMRWKASTRGKGLKEFTYCYQACQHWDHQPLYTISYLQINLSNVIRQLFWKHSFDKEEGL